MAWLSLIRAIGRLRFDVSVFDQAPFGLGQGLEIPFPARAPSGMPPPQPSKDRAGIFVVPLSQRATGASVQGQKTSPPSIICVRGVGAGLTAAWRIKSS